MFTGMKTRFLLSGQPFDVKSDSDTESGPETAGPSSSILGEGESTLQHSDDGQQSSLSGGGGDYSHSSLTTFNVQTSNTTNRKRPAPTQEEKDEYSTEDKEKEKEKATRDIEDMMSALPSEATDVEEIADQEEGDGGRTTAHKMSLRRNPKRSVKASRKSWITLEHDKFAKRKQNPKPKGATQVQPKNKRRRTSLVEDYPPPMNTTVLDKAYESLQKWKARNVRWPEFTLLIAQTRKDRALLWASVDTNNEEYLLQWIKDYCYPLNTSLAPALLIVEAQLELNIKCTVEKLMERFKLLFIAVLYHLWLLEADSDSQVFLSMIGNSLTLSEQSPSITAVQQAVKVVENEDRLYQHALLAFIPIWDIESAEMRQVRHPLQAGISRDSLISECEPHLNQAFYSTLLYMLYPTKVDRIPATRSLLIHALFATNPTIKLPKGAGAFLSTCKQLLGNTGFQSYKRRIFALRIFVGYLPYKRRIFALRIFGGYLPYICQPDFRRIFSGNPAGYTHVYPLDIRPNISPVELTAEGYRYALVTIDAFTRWPDIHRSTFGRSVLAKISSKAFATCRCLFPLKEQLRKFVDGRQQAWSPKIKLLAKSRETTPLSS
ncbi:hypothetical protein QOT17_021099 [Balamuthia mandrillaris]